MASRFQKCWYHTPDLTAFDLRHPFVILAIILLASCQRSVPTAFTTASLEMSQVISDSKALLLETDTLNMRAMARQIDKDLEAIQTALEASGDTLSKDTWLFLSDYRAHRKALDRLDAYYTEQLMEMRLCRRQWDALTDDVVNGLIKEQDLVTFANEELNAARRLQSNCQLFNDKLKARLESYRASQKRVNQIKAQVGAN